MRVPGFIRALSIALLTSWPVLAQDAAHDMSTMSGDSVTASHRHFMLQGIPLVTRAAPSAGGSPFTQAVLSQPVGMANGRFARSRGAYAATFDAEGLTMPNGELNTGGYGEGFVDRRHPHTYLHELMLTGFGETGAIKWSASAGRGFAPFGTDDPMMRPLVKFPINHHLAQILERATIIGALRAGALIVEGATFDGDEPTTPSSLPRASRFGDSWAARATLVISRGVELQASHARVASPEELSGYGLDQRKHSLSARSISGDGTRYVLVEWAKTTDRDPVRSRDVFDYASVLAEGAVQAGPMGIALRVEQSERPEEDRLAAAFRTPRPSTDLSTNGITRWRTVSLHVAAPASRRRTVDATPFVEVAALSADPRHPQSVFTPDRVYGTSRFLMLTAGVRVRGGDAHARMGRYGVADTGGPAIGGMQPRETQRQR